MNKILKMIRICKILLFLITCLLLAGKVFSQTEKVVFAIIGDKTIYEIQDKNILIFNAGFAIDADGSPKAYHPESGKGLDYLANAGKPGNWWALVTDNKGNPIVQSTKDPAPGYYISKTSLLDKSKKYSDPNCYVDSEKIPFIALPPRLLSVFKLGDIALVINRKNGKRCYAIFADVGPKNKIGEGSIYLASALNVKGTPKKGGLDSGITYILFKGSGKSSILSNNEIQDLGKSKLTETEITDLLSKY